jgi:hypothetical protein
VSNALVHAARTRLRFWLFRVARRFGRRSIETRPTGVPFEVYVIERRSLLGFSFVVRVTLAGQYWRSVSAPAPKET